jgi:sugar phosphate isomerase/epimerase
MKVSYLFYEPIRELADLDRRMRHLQALGYKGIELSAFHPLPYSVDDVRALVEKHRLPVVSMLSGWSYGEEGLCLASPEADVRRRAVERLGDYLRQAGRLGAVVVVGLMQGLRRDEPDEARAQERIADCLRQAARLAENANSTLVIEPVNHLQVGFNHTAAEVAALVSRIGSPAVSYMLDTIHLNIEERSVLDTIRRHGRHIRHFHLCESNGGPYGTGNVDFAAVLAELARADYPHYVSVKIYRQLGWEDGARLAADFLRCLLPDEPAMS